MATKTRSINLSKCIRDLLFYGMVSIISLLVVFSFDSRNIISQQTANATTSVALEENIPLLSANNTNEPPQSSLQKTSINSSSSPSRITENLVMGSFGNDRITGTLGNDIIIGLLGSDSIRGEDGDDKTQGGEEADQLYGGNGQDVLQGGTGSDQLYGGEGNDVITGGMDDDYLIGEQGNDKLYGSTGDDILLGGQGADYFDCGEGVDVVIDFNLAEGDDTAGNCEEVRTQ